MGLRILRITPRNSQRPSPRRASDSFAVVLDLLYACSCHRLAFLVTMPHKVPCDRVTLFLCLSSRCIYTTIHHQQQHTKDRASKLVAIVHNFSLDHSVRMRMYFFVRRFSFWVDKYGKSHPENAFTPGDVSRATDRDHGEFSTGNR